MILYLGSDRVKINLNKQTYTMNSISLLPDINSVLWSSNDCILKDSNGFYLGAKEED